MSNKPQNDFLQVAKQIGSDIWLGTKAIYTDPEFNFYRSAHMVFGYFVPTMLIKGFPIESLILVGAMAFIGWENRPQTNRPS